MVEPIVRSTFGPRAGHEGLSDVTKWLGLRAATPWSLLDVGAPADEERKLGVRQRSPIGHAHLADIEGGNGGSEKNRLE